MEEESLKLCQTDTSIFPCRFNDSSNKVIEDTVPFDGNVDVAKFTCGFVDLCSQLCRMVITGKIYLFKIKFSHHSDLIPT